MPSDVPVAPDAEAQGVNGLSMEQAASLATLVSDQHKRGKESKRLRDLTAEKYLYHIDGEGDAQWMDIVGGTRVDLTPNLDGGPRAQSNLLRPIVDDFVSYQTSIPYQVIAEPDSDRASRDKAMIDTIYGNHILNAQRLNEVFAEGLYLAAPYGSCPIHVRWRQDSPIDLSAALWNPNAPAIVPGRIDISTGDPWSMVYDPNATRRDLRWASYDITYPLEVVQEAFADVPGIENLKGRKDLPSSSRFQRISRRWSSLAGNRHGTAALNGTRDQDESVAVICRETAPGVLREWPQGRLTIIALSGVADPDDGHWGTPILLHDGPLPGERFSFVRLYAIDRMGDAYGKPFVADLDDLQVRRNNYETLILEGARRAAKPMLVSGPNSIDDDTAAYEEDGIIEALDRAGVPPQYLKYPTEWMGWLQKEIQRVEGDMFRIGGWQAASRGESNAGDPANKVALLQRADDSGKGPSNRGVQGAVVEVLQVAHALTKAYAGPVPLPVRVSGSDFGYLKSSYIHSDQLSNEPPLFKVVSGFASTPEAKAQQLLNLNQQRGADGEAVLPTKWLRKIYPDASIFPREVNLLETQDRRIQAINYAIRDAARELQSQAERAQQANPQMPAPPVAWLANQVHQSVFEKFPIQRIDPPQKHIEGLAEVAQDPSENPVAVQAALLRIDMLMQWQMEQAQQQQAMTQQTTQQQPAPTDGGQGEPQQADAGGSAPLVQREA